MTPEAAILQALAETQTEWGSSRFACFRRCQREHQLRYHLSVMPKGRALHFGVGSLVHAGLRYVSEGVMAGEPEPRNVDTLIQAAAAMPDSHPEACDEAARLLHWYFEHWGLENAGWPQEAKILGCEIGWEDATSFVLPYTGRADSVLEIAGEIVIVDTKTRKSGLPGDSKKGPDLQKRGAYAKKLATRAQFLGLSYLAKRAMGLDYYPPVWVNAICKLVLPTFGRVLVQFTPEQVEAWAEEQRKFTLTRGDGMCAGPEIYAPANYDACAPEMGFGCDYFDHCHGSEESRLLHYTYEGKK